MAIKLSHERLAEAHDLRIALAAGVEVGAALTAADGQAGQAVFEGLLEREELHRVELNRRVEAQAALIGTDGAIELHAVAAVDMNFALIVRPGHAERDLAVRLAHSLQKAGLLILGVLGDDSLNALENLFHGLNEKLFACVAGLNLIQNFLHIGVHFLQPPHIYWVCNDFVIQAAFATCFILSPHWGKVKTYPV